MSWTRPRSLASWLTLEEARSSRGSVRTKLFHPGEDYIHFFFLFMVERPRRPHRNAQPLKLKWKPPSVNIAGGVGHNKLVYVPCVRRKAARIFASTFLRSPAWCAGGPNEEGRDNLSASCLIAPTTLYIATSNACFRRSNGGVIDISLDRAKVVLRLIQPDQRCCDLASLQRSFVCRKVSRPRSVCPAYRLRRNRRQWTAWTACTSPPGRAGRRRVVGRRIRRRRVVRDYDVC